MRKIFRLSFRVCKMMLLKFQWRTKHFRQRTCDQECTIHLDKFIQNKKIKSRIKEDLRTFIVIQFLFSDAETTYDSGGGSRIGAVAISSSWNESTDWVRRGYGREPSRYRFKIYIHILFKKVKVSNLLKFEKLIVLLILTPYLPAIHRQSIWLITFIG